VKGTKGKKGGVYAVESVFLGLERGNPGGVFKKKRRCRF